jgi:hypothetical protein
VFRNLSFPKIQSGGIRAVRQNQRIIRCDERPRQMHFLASGSQSPSWSSGRVGCTLRLEIETDHEAQIFGQAINFFHIENWYSVHSVIRATLKLMGLLPSNFFISSPTNYQ